MMSANLPIVLLTNPIDPAGEAILRPHARLVTAPDNTAATLTALARDAEGIIVRTPLPAEAVEQATKLRGIVRHGAGLDMVPLSAATARRIPVASVPGANAQAVAEYCFAVAFELYRQLARVDSNLRKQGWSGARAQASGARELRGRVLGVVGVGAVGRRVAQIGAAGYAMSVLGATRRPETLPPDVRPVALPELFELSDIIVVSCPLTEQTRGLVDGPLLDRARRDAILVNVSRGAVVDGAALAAALRGGRLAGAALDVFDPQPLPPGHAFFDVPNLLLTPHIAGLTRESMIEMSTRSAWEMVRILAGERPLELANPEIYA